MGINWNVRSPFDGKEIPTYGNYGGPGYADGHLLAKGEQATFTAQPIDALDNLFRNHDMAYESVSTLDRARADIALIRGIAALPSSQLSTEAAAYAGFTTLAFIYQIAYSYNAAYLMSASDFALVNNAIENLSRGFGGDDRLMTIVNGAVEDLIKGNASSPGLAALIDELDSLTPPHIATGNVSFSLSAGLWGPGTEEINKAWTEASSPFYWSLSGSASTPPLGFSSSSLWANVKLSADYGFGFGILGNIKLATGSADLIYDLNVSETHSSADTAWVTGAFVSTQNWYQTYSEMHTDGIDVSESSIDLDFKARAFANIKAVYNIGYDVGFDTFWGRVSAHDQWTGTLFNFTAVDFTQTVPLVHLNGANASKDLDFGPFDLHVALPDTPDGFASGFAPDDSGLARLTTQVTSTSILTASFSISEAFQLLFPEFAWAVGGSGGFDIGILKGKYSYNTIDLKLVGDVSLAQKVDFDPAYVKASLTSSFGETLNGRLGDTFHFATPEGEGTFEVTARYSAVGTLTTTTDLVLSTRAEYAILKLYAAAGVSFGLPFGWGHANINLGELNWTAFQGSAPIGSAKTIPVWSVSTQYETTQSTQTYTVAYEKFYTGTANSDFITFTTHQVSITALAGGDVIVGNDLDNTIDGGDGDDTLYGAGGNDTLLGGAGANRLYGEAGDDRLFSVSTGGTPDRLDGGSGIDTAALDRHTATQAFNFVFDSSGVEQTLTDGTVLTGIERLDIALGAGDDQVTGGALGDIIRGGDGSDQLSGGAGDDVVAGGGGLNRLSGGSGDDVVSTSSAGDQVYGNDGTDTAEIDRQASTSNITLDLSAATAEGGEGQVLVLDDGTRLEGIERIRFIGGSGINFITGGTLADELIGGGNADVLAGGNGDDVIQGRGGSDVLLGGNGIDELSYENSQQAVTVNLARGKADGGDAAGDSFFDFESVRGSAFDDVLYGIARGGTISGGAGNDIIGGELYSNRVDGGEGIDTLDFSTDPDNTQLWITLKDGYASNLQEITGIENVTAGAFNDTITGSAVANIILGGGGNDTIEGGAGADTLDGGIGVNTLVYQGSASGIMVNLVTGKGTGGDAAGDSVSNFQDVVGSQFNDTIIAGAGNNRLTGGLGNDTLVGGTGDDILIGGAGGDTLKGGDATDKDTVDYSQSDGDVFVNLKKGTASGGYATGDVISGVENIIGSSGNDRLTGNDSVNDLSGDWGNDILAGGAAGDILRGGEGIDTASYAESMQGVTIDLRSNAAQKGAGDGAGDILSDIENLTGSAFDDSLTGSADANVMAGGAGNDTLTGLAGPDVLDGGLGSDTVAYGSSLGGVTINLATGIAQGGDAQGDTLVSIENVSGSNKADSLTGNAGDNELSGQDGDDLIEGGAGKDRIDGGAGTGDTVSYAGSQAGVELALSLTAGVAAAGKLGDAAGDAVKNVENITGSGFADALTGNNDANLLKGGAGDDVLSGLLGADRLDGGDGTDTASYSKSALGVTIDLALKTAAGGEAAGDTLVNIENVIGAAAAANKITGNAQDNRLVGGSLADTLTGGAGDDVILGGAGLDVQNGGDGSDTVSYENTAAAVTINLAAGTAVQTGVTGTEILTSFENAIGSAAGDKITGTTGANRISGLAGNDTFVADAGADWYDGGSDSGGDTIDYGASKAGVTVDLLLGTASGGDAQGDTLLNMENVTGSANADRLTGNAGNNILAGGAGDDIIVDGGLGADTLDGGTGTNDTLSYEKSLAGVTISLAGNTASGGDAKGDKISNFENVTGSSGADNITGSTAANTISGGAGDDVINGGAGADVLSGGDGIDTLDYSSASTLPVTVNLRTGAVSGGDAAGDTISGFENVTGTNNADRLTGDAGANVLRGGGGSDTLQGGGGADTLDGEGGSNVASYDESLAGVTVSLATGLGAGGDAEGDRLFNIQSLIGSSQADVLTGSTLANSLAGGGGDDFIMGGAAGDTLAGGDGTDTVSYALSGLGVTVNLSLTTKQISAGTEADGDVLSGFENIDGSAFGDVLTGDGKANRLSGGAGNDVLAGLGGADQLIGGDGADTADYSASPATAGVTVNLAAGTGKGGDAEGDTLVGIENVTGTAGADALTGSIESNRLDGGLGDDTLDGGLGDDFLTGGAGRDRLNGGGGIDLLNYETSAAGVTINLLTGEASGGDAQGDTFASVENVIGSATGDDTLTGDTAANMLRGGGGNDVIEGGLGGDNLDGGANGAKGDTLRYAGSFAGVAVNLGTGAADGGDATGDMIANFENLTGSAFDDLLIGSAAANIISGGDGSDIIAGGLGADNLTGGDGPGIDTLSYEASALGVTVNLLTNSTVGSVVGGDAAGDKIGGFENVMGSKVADSLTGSDGANRLAGGAGNDTIHGGGGDDVIVGGAGADALFGDAGSNDTVSYEGSSAAVKIVLNSGVQSGGDATNDTLSGFENVIGSAGDDTITGDGGNNFLSGGAGNDTLSGGLGLNTLEGGAGADKLVGGADIDTADYTRSGAAVTVNLAVLLQKSTGDANGDSLTSIENVNGSVFADTLSGNTANNVLSGGAGDDALAGGFGADTLLGGLGNDVLTGGAGADVLDGGDGIDTADYSSTVAPLVIDLTAPGIPLTTASDALGDTLIGIENIRGTDDGDRLTGDAAGNVFWGEKGDDELSGGAGDDQLYGSRGVDILRGGDGNDLLSGGELGDDLDGGDGIDTLSYQNETKGVSVNLATGEASLGGAAGDTIANFENIIGTLAGDVLIGNEADNLIIGGAGAIDPKTDTFVGDTMDGGGGIDTLSYRDSINGVSVDLLTGASSGGDAEGDTIANFENLIGSAKADTLKGDGGVNFIIGGAGADTLDGRGGVDTLSYEGSSAGVSVDLGAATAAGGDAEGDSIARFENLIGSDQADVLKGTGGQNRIDGRGGDDLIEGRGGADKLFGGDGLDTLSYRESADGVTVDLTAGTAAGGGAEGDTISGFENLIGSTAADTLTGTSAANVIEGGAGGDVMDGGDGLDTLSYAASDAGVAVDIDARTAAGGHAAGDSFTSFENLTGSGFSDLLRGGGGTNVISGGGGDDTIAGGAGADVLAGGENGASGDTLDYADSDAGVFVDLALNRALGGHAAGDVISGFENVTGSILSDTLRGDANSNYITGGQGGDVLFGGGGSDTLGYRGSAAGVTVNLLASTASGGDATGDVIQGFSNVDGSDLADVLTGSALGNRLIGRGGDDVLTGGAGADTLDGGDGVDTAIYGGTIGVTVNLETGAGDGGDAKGDVLISVENVTGTGQGDTLTGSAAANILLGGAGDDTLLGGAGGDTLAGGDGLKDTLSYVTSAAGVVVDIKANTASGGDAEGDIISGFENVIGSALADVIAGGVGANVLSGGDGSDTLVYASSAEGVAIDLALNTAKFGDAAGDRISGFENVTGSAKDDTLVGSAEANTLDGGEGNDTIRGGAGGDILKGGGGLDTLSYAGSSTGVIVDLATNAVGLGDAAGDVISDFENVTASSGDDIIKASGSANVLVGGDGVDTLSYEASTAAVNVNLLLGTADGGFAAGDTISGFEKLIGSASGDRLTGNAGANDISGGLGDDVIEGGAGADRLSGEADNDWLSYATSDAAVTVDIGQNTARGGHAEGDIISSFENLVGSAYGDTLEGSDGDNVLVGGAGADILLGGAGADTASYVTSLQGVSIDLTLALASGGDAEGDALSNIENVIGSSANDALVGSAGVNVLKGGAGDDIIEGAGGADILDGGDGIDTLAYVSSAAAVTVNLNGGTAQGGDAEGDQITGFENVIGSAGDDWLTGANDQANTLAGGAGDDVIDGRSGDDLLIGGAGADVLTGGDGWDRADYSASGAGVAVSLTGIAGKGGDAEGDTLNQVESVVGSAFADYLEGGFTEAELLGGGGDDVIAAGFSAETLDGGEGMDILSFRTTWQSVNINLAASTASGGYAEGDTIRGFESVIGSGAADVIVGDDRDNLIGGGWGADVMSGGGGSDTLAYNLFDTGMGVEVSLAEGTASGGDAWGDVFDGFENVIGSMHGDVLVGDSGGNTLWGGEDADLLRGGGGDDLLWGGAGADDMQGQDGFDTVSYLDSTAAVVVDLSQNTASGGDAEGDVIAETEGVIGSMFADTITGQDSGNGIDGNNTLVGAGGDDTIRGRSGDDVIEGGIGADTLDGGTNMTKGDTLSYASSLAGVSVNLATSLVSGGDADGDVITGFENLIGSAFDDRLTGDNGVNVISGGAGNDVIAGGLGPDVLDGGAGIDTFDYSAQSSVPSGSVLTITLNGTSKTTVTILSGTVTTKDDVISGFENVIGSVNADTIVGDGGNNALSGGAGNDSIKGGAGNDLITGGGGGDTLDGGTGINTLSYEGSVAGVTADLKKNQFTLGDASNDVIAVATFQNLSGSSKADTLGGSTTDNVLSGGGGNDLLQGYAGKDLLDGGDGIDTAIYADSASGVKVSLLTGLGSAADAEGDRLVNIENLTGSALGDELTGDGGANEINGGLGNDLIIGGAGADKLTGGGQASDAVSYRTSYSAVTVDLKANTAAGGDAEGDTIKGFFWAYGSGHDDTLTGNDSANALFGLSGNDVLTGGAGADTLEGGDGIDTANYFNATSTIGVTVSLASTTAQVSGGDASGDILRSIENVIGTAGVDVLTGDGAANVLTGNAGSDTLTGGGGDDVLIGGTGLKDTLSGGDGRDRVDYASSGQGVTVNLLTLVLSGGDAAGDVISSIEDVSGSALKDTLTGSDGDNRMWGAGGDDVIQGGKGNDSVSGGAGADTLAGGDGFDNLDYADSNSGVTVDLSTQTASGGYAAGDIISGFEQITGSAFADTLSGDAGVNRIGGGAGDDVIAGGLGADTLEGGDGIDTLDYTGSAAGVTISLAALKADGGDAVGDAITGFENIWGSARADRLTGDGGANVLIGNDGADVITAGSGDDRVEGGSGGDTLTGGGGIDTLSYAGSGAAVSVDLGNAVFAGGDASGDDATGFENLIGTAKSDTLIGDDADNAISGGMGDDTIRGGLGADDLDGGDGSDTLSYEDFFGGVTVNLASGQATGIAADGDRFRNFENLTGSFGSDTLTGDAAANILAGGEGNDMLAGAGGADRLIGGNSLDIADYSGSDAAVTVNLRVGAGSGGDATGDILIGIEGLTGSAFDDILIGGLTGGIFDGGDGNDRLTGSSEWDQISGGAGDDVIAGGTGSDWMVGGTGSDTLDYTASKAGVTVSFLSNSGSGGDADGDGFTGFENITGSALADVLTGAAGSNVLTGGAGDDVIAGGAGADTLSGGDGFDTLDYGSSATGVAVDLVTGAFAGGDAEGDTVSGFEAVIGSAFDDTLNAGLTGSTLTGGDGDDELISGIGSDVLAGGDGADTLSYATSGGGVSVDLATASVSGGFATGDTVSGFENVTGSSFADTITGDGGGNRIAGGGGDDTLTGAGGADFINGGAGSDTIAGGEGSDSLSGGAGADAMTGGADDDVMSGGDGSDTIDGGDGWDTVIFGGGASEDAGLGVFVNLSGDEQGLNDLPVAAHSATDGAGTVDLLSDVEEVWGTANADYMIAGDGSVRLDGRGGDDDLGGGASADTLVGGDGDDLLVGSGGNDRLEGGADADMLYGGSNADTFVFEGALADDIVGDFEQGLDTVELRGIVASFDELLLTGNGTAEIIVSIAETGEQIVTLRSNDAMTLGLGDFAIL